LSALSNTQTENTMTDTTEDALFEAAWKTREAINSAEHSGDAEKAAQLSKELEALQTRVKAREAEHEASMEALRAFHRMQVGAGMPAAPNHQAARVIDPRSYIDQAGDYFAARGSIQADLEDDGIVDLTDMTESYPDEDEHSTAKSNGALS
jgi:hypothetical protein